MLDSEPKPEQPSMPAVANPTYNTPYSAIEDLHSFQNAGAWERFINHYRPLVSEIARRKGIQDADDREHILTDVCLKLHEQFQKREEEDPERDIDPEEKLGYWVREKGKFRTWLWGLAEFKCLEFNRGRIRETERQQKHVGLHGEGGRGLENDPDGGIAHQLVDPIDELERRLTQGFLEECLRQLFESGEVKPRDARIFVQRIVQDIPADKLAREHKTSVNNIYQIVHGIRKHLRPMLSDYLENGTSPKEDSGE